MLILAFGTYDKEKHPRIAVLLSGLAERGTRVEELNRPLAFSTAERVEALRKPWLIHRPVRAVTRSWIGLTRDSRRHRRRNRPDAVVVGYLGHFDVLLARLLFPRTPIVLDQMVFAADTARDRGVRSRPGLWILEHIDWLACRAADVVVVDTVEHADLILPSRRSRAVVVPVGASDEWFAAGQERNAPSGGPLRVVFFGLFTPLQGSRTIGEALGLLADHHDIEVTMIGHGQDLEQTRRLAAANDRVTWLNWVDGADLPELVASFDVCLGIFGTSAKAQHVVPNKVYQGAAAGCALVTSATAPQGRALGEAAVYVPAGDAEALAQALSDLAADRERAAALGRAAAETARSRFRPESVVESLIEALSPPLRS